jgi:hypothetical protein
VGVGTGVGVGAVVVVVGTGVGVGAVVVVVGTGGCVGTGQMTRPPEDVQTTAVGVGVAVVPLHEHPARQATAATTRMTACLTVEARTAEC